GVSKPYRTTSASLDLVPVPGDPQRDGPCAVDAGKQQERDRARDGVGRERFLGNQSGRAGDQARVAEYRHERKLSPVEPIKRVEIELALLEDDLNLTDEAS